MKQVVVALFVFFSLIFTSFAEMTLKANGTFSPLTQSARVKGTVEIFHDSEKDLIYVVLHDFYFRGSVGPIDLKICGNIDDFPPFTNICLSIGEPKSMLKKQTFRMRNQFITFKKALIFDLDIGNNLAQAPLSL